MTTDRTLLCTNAHETAPPAQSWEWCCSHAQLRAIASAMLLGSYCTSAVTDTLKGLTVNSIM